MDLITQGILGAAVGQAGFQKRLGRKAIVWGALIGFVPDLDVVIRSSSDPFLQLIHHRGFSHSLFFSLIIAPIVGYLLWRHYQKKTTEDKVPLTTWISLAMWVLLTHPLLDLLTVYGTQLLWPFSNYRFSLSAIGVIDPVYSGALLLSVFIGLRLKRCPYISQMIATVALFFTSGYLFYGLEMNQTAERLATTELTRANIPFQDLKSYTTILQLPLRRVVARVGEEVWVGFINVNHPTTILWQKHKQPSTEWAHPLLNTTQGKIFTWFCDNQYTVFKERIAGNMHKIIVMDSRFGYPGPNVFGIWGIIAEVDDKGRVLSNIDWMSTSRDISWKKIQQLWHIAFPKK